MESPFPPSALTDPFMTHHPRSLRAIGWLERMLRLPRMTLCAWWTDGLMLIKRARVWLAGHRRSVCLYLLLSVFSVAVLMSWDRVLLSIIRQEQARGGLELVHQAALALSYWGDFLGFNMLVFAGLGLIARLRKSLFFRRLVIAAVIGTVTCGTMANVSRMVTGRARPSYKGEPGFHGPTFSASRQSFPSAHTATAFGASVPVAVALPPVGVPMLIVSAGVSWSRMHNNRHHPSDVLTSILLSILVGVPLGVVVRRMRRIELQRRRMSTTASVQLERAPLKPSIT